MKYRMPPDHECLDLLTESEYDACANDVEALARGRARAWERHRANGPTNRIRALTMGAVGGSALLEGYYSTQQVSALVRSVSLAEGAQFTSKIERSLVDDSIVGVRVTLVAFTR